MYKLTKKQQLYIDTALANPKTTDAEIARMIEVSHKQICQWKKQEEFNAAYDAALKEQWKGALKMAQAKIIELANCGKPDVEMKAASYIADSNGLKAIDKVEVDANVNTIKVEVID